MGHPHLSSFSGRIGFAATCEGAVVPEKEDSAGRIVEDGGVLRKRSLPLLSDVHYPDFRSCRALDRDLNFPHARVLVELQAGPYYLGVALHLIGVSRSRGVDHAVRPRSVNCGQDIEKALQSKPEAVVNTPQ